MWEVKCSNDSEHKCWIGFRTSSYDEAVDKGAEILVKNPSALVILRGLGLSFKQIKEEIKRDIQNFCSNTKDYAPFVFSCMVFDEGAAGGEYFGISNEEYKRLALEALEELLE